MTKPRPKREKGDPTEHPVDVKRQEPTQAVVRPNPRKIDNRLKREPELMAGVLDMASEPFMSVMQKGQELGLDPKILKRMIERVRSRYQPVLEEMQEHSTQSILGLLNDRIGRALGYLDDYALADASAKDLAIIVGILLEKHQLLQNRPTHIISVEERMALNELVPEIVREAQRRGMTIDLNAEDVIVTDGPVERQTRPRSGSGGLLPQDIGRMRNEQATGEADAKRRPD